LPIFFFLSDEDNSPLSLNIGVLCHR